MSGKRWEGETWGSLVIEVSDGGVAFQHGAGEHSVVTSYHVMEALRRARANARG
jgi:hypothetical protein